MGAYDAFNRLLSVQETSTGGNWTQTFDYDRYGNRWQTSPTPPTLETPQTSNWYVATCPGGGSSCNRIGGWNYDGRGNIQSIANMQRTFTYDAENRQISSSINGNAATYNYDGEGRRILKTSGGVTSTFVYDAFGNLAAEYGGQNSSVGTQYLNVDHLGSTRLVTDANGAAVQCRDYRPFGDEILAGISGRGSCFPSATGGAIEFTSKERDAETGLDFFGARYNASSQGRFTSVDPVFATASLFNPQSWNGYTYTLNNPFKYVDPSGDFPIPAIIAAVGAGVGGIAGAAGEYLSQRSQYGHVENGWRIVTAAGGGALAGGLAGAVLVLELPRAWLLGWGNWP